MSQASVELLLFTFAALFCGLLLFVADVLQRIFNDMDTAAFARFMPLLYKRAGYSPFVLASTIVPFFGMFVYLIFFGFDNIIFVAGLVIFAIGITVAKQINGPLYRQIMDADPSDSSYLTGKRKRLQVANISRAAIAVAGLVVMYFGLI
tara:strand:- start:5 stop:451 length:447 start_codon:yes stop_codon:yes gene_type:complete